MKSIRNKTPLTFGPELVIFTDLDGTLLDHHTYSWDAARPALERCKALGIPVIICSSKSRSEIEHIRREMGNDHPFISENGGGVYIPAAMFPSPDSSHSGPFWVLKMGIPHDQLRKALEKIREETGVEIAGFSDMDDDELASLTGLEGDALERARQREFDEPFTILNETPEKVSRVQEAIQKLGLVYTKGGRFHHITGNNDKGRALRKIMELYKSFNRLAKSVALGDSLNDLPMLHAADIPILVKKSDGTHDPTVHLRGLLRADGVGPHGWNEEVLKLLRQIRSE